MLATAVVDSLCSPFVPLEALPPELRHLHWHRAPLEPAAAAAAAAPPPRPRDAWLSAGREAL